MAKAKTLEDAFLETLKDVYYAEKQAVRMLQKASKASKSQELQEAFATHRAESEGQVERLEQVFELLGKPARAKTCEAIQGLNDEMSGDPRGFWRQPGGRCRADRGGASRRALRDRPLRHPQDLGEPARDDGGG